MRTVSADFERVLQSGSMDSVIKVEVLHQGQVIDTLTGDIGGVVLDGTVTMDRENAIQRRASLYIADPVRLRTPDYSFLYSTPEGGLSPYGNELRIYRGLMVNRKPELVSLGIFGISDVQITDSNSGGSSFVSSGRTDSALTISITGYDRSRKVSRNKFDAIYKIAAGTNYATAIRSLIQSRVSGLSYNFQTTTYATPALVFDVGDDPWDKAREMAKSMGAELFFDGDGICVLRPITASVNLPTSWEYREGDNAIILDVDRQITDEDAYNKVVVTGETTDDAPPVRAVAQDDNPESHTYVGGPYGVVTRHEVSSLIKTTAQAQAAADALLDQAVGGTEKVTITAIPHPGHEPGDVIYVQRARANVAARYVMDSFDIPLSPTGRLKCVSRKRRVGS
jgi:hypothetical protein